MNYARLLSLPITTPLQNCIRATIFSVMVMTASIVHADPEQDLPGFVKQLVDVCNEARNTETENRLEVFRNNGFHENPSLIDLHRTFSLREAAALVNVSVLSDAQVDQLITTGMSFFQPPMDHGPFLMEISGAPDATLVVSLPTRLNSREPSEYTEMLCIARFFGFVDGDKITRIFETLPYSRHNYNSPLNLSKFASGTVRLDLPSSVQTEEDDVLTIESLRGVEYRHDNRPVFSISISLGYGQ